MSKINRGLALLMAAAMLTGMVNLGGVQVGAAQARQVESLDRGLVVSGAASGVLVSWRYLGTDSADTVFKLYRGSQLVYTSGEGMATCYNDVSGSTGDSYTLQVCRADGTVVKTEKTDYVLSYDKTAKGGYFDMQLDRPTDSRLGATYTPNDASVADLDGDGKYELIVKWDPNNSQDNSKDGATSNVIVDAYTIESGDATRLWRIDLGQNIRAGAHYTQFIAYDLDGDGCGEIVCKTAPGSKDGTGAYVSKASTVSAIKNASDNEKAYANSTGRVLDGSEYLTLFDGKTGKALDTIYYEPARGTVSDWGDAYGNRVDRFLAGVAYLNGTTPSVVMCRGYYTRTVLAAYDVVNKRLSKRWLFDSNSNKDYAGQGNHNLVAADADGDGYDEIIYGSMTIDHNGKGLYSTGLQHGDAIHVGDLVPERSGLEVYQVLEETYGASLRDAKTGKSIQRWNATSDTGRGVADNIIAGNSGAEFCSSADGVIYNSSGTKVADWSAVTKWGQNSLVYWDGDLEREVLDRTMIDDYPNGRLFTGQNVTYNNGSKSNVCITADIFGDWREELVAPLSDGSGVRVYATPYTTDYRIYTLMHNTQYRCGVAAENVGYNQPPHVDYWLGTGSALPSQPSVYAAAEQAVEYKAVLRGDDAAEGDYTQPFVVDSCFKMVASAEGNIVVAQDSKQVGEETINKRINLKVKGSPTASAIEITAEEAGDLYVGVLSGNSSAARNLSVCDSSNTRIALLDAPVSGTENVELQKVTLPSSGKYYIYSGAGSVYIYFIGSTARLSKYAEQTTVTTEKQTETTTKQTETTTKNVEQTTEATTTKPVSGGKSHSFGNGISSDYFAITGSLSTNYGAVSYNGQTISQCLKIESKTTIDFASDTDETLTLVFNADSSGKNIKVDDVTYTVPADGVLTVAVSKGAHTVKKGSGSSYLFYMNVGGGGQSDTTKATTETTTEATTKATTTQTTTVATTEATTQTTTVATTQTTTVTTTETTTAATTEPTTETTTEAAPEGVKVYAKDGYSFDGLSGNLTSDSSYGGAYVLVTGNAAAEGNNYVSLTGDGYAYVADKDTAATTILVMPVQTKGNRLTFNCSFKLPTTNNNWSFLQLHGVKKDGTASEIAGIRTSGGAYCLRTMGDNASLVTTGVATEANKDVSCEITVDMVNSKAYLTIGSSTVSGDVDCGGVGELRYFTATGERNLYAGKTSWSALLLGDADGNGLLERADGASILKNISDVKSVENSALADVNCDGKIDFKDCITVLSLIQ